MDKIDKQEEIQFQELMEPIFGKQVYSWTVNIKVLELFEELIATSSSCSKYMDMVPRPFYFGNSIKWISKQARNAVIRNLKQGDKNYLICLRVSGLKMKHQFVMASRGI